MNKEVKELIERLKDNANSDDYDENGYFFALYISDKDLLLDYINQLEEENKDAVFTKEETEKLLKQFQELDKCDTALTSSLMLRRKHFENELLKKKITQLETNRDEAIELLTKGFNFCENDSQGEIDICNIAINREKKAIEILERGKE